MNLRAKLPAAKPYSINSLADIPGGLRRTVAARLMRDFGVRISPPLIRRVLDEAMEVAQETGFPNLFFPAVAEEKARFVFTALAGSSSRQSPRPLRHAA
jgi:hypothetical protein